MCIINLSLFKEEVMFFIEKEKSFKNSKNDDSFHRSSALINLIDFEKKMMHTLRKLFVKINDLLICEPVSFVHFCLIFVKIIM